VIILNQKQNNLSALKILTQYKTIIWNKLRILSMQRYRVYFIWKLLYMFWVVTPPIIRSANNCIYSIWYLSHRYRYLPL
jgi:hypothetical protein